MKLYYGFNVAVKAPNLVKCKKYKDFGKGFYLMIIEEQAIVMAKRIAIEMVANQLLLALSLMNSNLDKLNVK